MYKDGNSVKENECCSKHNDLDFLPYMDRTMLESYVKKYPELVEASIVSSRGCAYAHCSYCTIRSYEMIQRGNRIRYRTLENIVNEIDRIHEIFNVTRFNFEDDNFIISGENGQARLRKFAELIKKLPYKITFTFFCRVDATDLEIFKSLKEVGLRGIYLGVESFNDRTLQFFEKGIVAEQIIRAFDMLKSIEFSAEVGAEYRIHVGFITWHPEVTFEELRGNLAIVLKYNLPPKLLTRKLSLYKGCSLYNLYNETSRVKDEFDWDYRISIMRKIQEAVSEFFANVNSIRDRIRTLEKIAQHKKRNADEINILKKHRIFLDELCLLFFDELLTEDVLSDETKNILKDNYKKLSNYFIDNSLIEILNKQYDVVGLEYNNKDIFRK